MTPPLCPTCGRRASIRWWPTPIKTASECFDPFHDAADYGPMLLEACKGLKDAIRQESGGGNRRSFHVLAKLREADEVCAAAEGRKEEHTP
jgi:hypothetical protein